MLGNFVMNTKIHLTPHGQKNLISFSARLLVWSILCSITVFTALPVASAPFAYVTNFYYNPGYGNTVTILDTATNAIVDAITVGNAPEGLAVSPDGKRVYVANSLSNSVSVIDTATKSVVGTVAVGVGPSSLTVSPDGKRVYVPNWYNNTVSVIDTMTNTIIGTIPVGKAPNALAITPNGNRLYVSNFYNDNISVIDTQSNSVVETVNLDSPSYLYDMAMTPDGKRIYATIFNKNTVLVIDTMTNTVVNTVAVGLEPDGVTVSPDGKRVYVANATDWTVSVIDTNTNAILNTIYIGYYGFPQNMAVTPDGKHVYVTSSSSVSPNLSVIDTTTSTVVDTIDVGSTAWDIAIIPLPTAISFSTFCIKQLLIERHHESLFLLSDFTTGKASNGIDPRKEQVTLKIGNVTLTIPPGSFHKNRHGVFAFDGQIDNMSIDALIKPWSHNRYGFEAAVYGADLSRSIADYGV
jgi:YVTN family beta-propeller protein